MSGAGRFPPKDKLTICFAHAAYRLGEEFERRAAGVSFFEVRTREALQERLEEVNVLVVSSLWRNEDVERAPRLRYIQSVSAGTEQYDLSALHARGMKLANASGVNQTAVAEHAMALLLMLARGLHLARDSQRARVWSTGRPGRENRPRELAGAHVLVVGFGRIGASFAALARGFGMHVTGVARSARNDGFEVRPFTELDALLPQSDFVVLTCALSEPTRGLFDARRLKLMKPSACLINVSRGAVAPEDALTAALRAGSIRGAALDCFEREPLPPESALWDLDDVIITAHTAGDTPHYEARVVDILLENLERLTQGATPLRNEIV